MFNYFLDHKRPAEVWKESEQICYFDFKPDLIPLPTFRYWALRRPWLLLGLRLGGIVSKLRFEL